MSVKLRNTHNVVMSMLVCGHVTAQAQTQQCLLSGAVNTCGKVDLERI